MTSYVLRTGQPLLWTPERFAELQAAGEVVPIGAPSVDWLGVPLKSGDVTWGVIGVQTYDESKRYTSQDRDVLVFVAQHVATAIEQKRQEDALRESERRYRQMFENTRAVQLVIDPESGAIIDANAAAAEYYGWPVEQLRGKRIWDINVLGEEGVRSEMARANQQNRNYFIFQHRLASGEVRDVEVHSGPIEIGGRQLLYSIIHDITERRRAEQTLRTQTAAMKAAMDGIGIVNERLDFTYANEALAKLFGWPNAQSLIG